MKTFATQHLGYLKSSVLQTTYDYIMRYKYKVSRMLQNFFISCVYVSDLQKRFHISFSSSYKSNVWIYLNFYITVAPGVLTANCLSTNWEVSWSVSSRKSFRCEQFWLVIYLPSSLLKVFVKFLIFYITCLKCLHTVTASLKYFLISWIILIFF